MAIWRSLRSLILRRRLERGLDAELRFHLEMAIEENVRRGMSHSEAYRAARLAFGQGDVIREDCQQAWGVRQIDMVVQDVRHGVRSLRRNPGFACVAVVTLALGIAATTVVFSIIDSILLNPVPFRDAERLVEIWLWHERGGGNAQPAGMLPRWREQTHIFEQIEAHWEGSYALTGTDEPEAVYGSQISAGLLPFLGVQPQLGRSFSPDESEARVALISHGLWLRRFGGDSDIVGRPLRVNDDLFTIIGVMPHWFRFPVGRVELWISFDPLRPNPQALRRSVSVIARLREGLALQQADEQVAALAPRLDETLASVSKGTARLQSLNRYATTGPVGQAWFVARPRAALFLIFGAAGLVLLASCANSANLFLSRALSRSHDIAVRVAVGGSRPRLVREMVTEALVLAAIAGSLGLLLAAWALGGLTTVIPAGLADDSLNPLDLDGRAALWSVLASVVAGLLASLLPALRAVHGDVVAPLKNRADPSVRGHMALRGFLISVESALALVLLVGAGLMARSLWTLMHVDTGWSGEPVIIVEPQFRGARYASPASRAEVFARLTDVVSATPGVQAVAVAEAMPLALTAISYGPLKSDIATIPDAVWTINRISSSYFQVLGIPVRQGWVFDDWSAGVQDQVIVSQEVARRLWPDENPIGRRLFVKQDGSESWTVVGVVADVQSMRFDSPSEPLELYRPLTAAPGPGSGANAYRYLSVRSDGRVGLAMALRQRARTLDPELPALIRPMRDIYRDSLADPEFYTRLLTGFAILALLLAGSGLYAVVAYEASRRTQEMGIRLALGATKSDVIRHVMGPCMLLATVGVIVGIGAALALTRLMSSMLYEIKPIDPPTFAAAALFLLVAAALAGYLPARRATKVNPVEALKAE